MKLFFRLVFIVLFIVALILFVFEFNKSMPKRHRRNMSVINSSTASPDPIVVFTDRQQHEQEGGRGNNATRIFFVSSFSTNYLMSQVKNSSLSIFSSIINEPITYFVDSLDEIERRSRSTATALLKQLSLNQPLSQLRSFNSSLASEYAKVEDKIDEFYRYRGRHEPFEGQLRLRSAKLLFRKVLAIYLALSESLQTCRQLCLLVWIDADVHLLRALDDNFVRFVANFDIVYIPLRGERALASAHWRIESGFMSFLVSNVTRSLVKSALDVYNGALLSMLRTCETATAVDVALLESCESEWFRFNTYLNDVYVWSLLLHGSIEKSKLLKRFLPLLPMDLRQAWFATSLSRQCSKRAPLHLAMALNPHVHEYSRRARFEGYCAGSNQSYVSPFNLLSYAMHWMKSGDYSIRRGQSSRLQAESIQFANASDISLECTGYGCL